MNQQLRRLFAQLVNTSKARCACRGFASSGRHHKVKISYEVYPKGSKLESAQQPPIFILHGMFGSKANWHSLAKRISFTTHRQVVTFDARNHGNSEHTPFMDYLTMRDDLLGVMDMLKVERPVLLGHSMGGKTVMSCALSVPERVDSLIVVDTAPRDSPGADTLKMYAQRMKEITLPPPSTSFLEGRRLVGQQLTFVPEISVRQFLLTNLKQLSDNSFSWRVNLDAIIDNFDSLHSFPQFSDPCTVIPTIFIGGGKSLHVASSAESCIYRLFPDTSIKLIPFAGHWVHAEKPAQFVELVTQFLLSP